MRKKFYIKERHNPQLGIAYYCMGQMTKKDAKKHEESLYGYNILLPYETEEEYKTATEKLKSEGKRVF